MEQDYFEGTDYLSGVPGEGDRTEEYEYEVCDTHVLTHRISAAIEPFVQINNYNLNLINQVNLFLIKPNCCENPHFFIYIYFLIYDILTLRSKYNSNVAL